MIKFDPVCILDTEESVQVISSPEAVDVPVSSPEPDIQVSSEEKESEQEVEELPLVDVPKEVQEGWSVFSDLL